MMFWLVNFIPQTFAILPLLKNLIFFLTVALRERIKTDSPKEASMILILTSFNNSEHLKRVIEIAMKAGQCSYTSNLVFPICISFGTG